MNYNIIKLFNPKWTCISSYKGTSNVYHYYKIVYDNNCFIFNFIENNKTGNITCKINGIVYIGIQNITYKIHNFLFDYEFKIIQKELKITTKRIRYYDTILRILSNKLNTDVIKLIIMQIR